MKPTMLIMTDHYKKVNGVGVYIDWWITQQPDYNCVVWELGDPWPKKPEVIVTNTRFFTSSVIGALLSKWWNIQHIHIEHGTERVYHRKWIVRKLVGWYDMTISRMVLASADNKIAVGKAVRKYLGKCWYQPMILSKRIYRGKRCGVVYIGRRTEEKGVHDLIYAANEARVFVHVIGDGPINHCGHRGYVTCHDAVPHDEALEIIKRAKCLVLPSYAEGNSLVIQEALSFGTPVIATNVGEAPYLLSDDCLFEPGDRKRLTKLLMGYVNE